MFTSKVCDPRTPSFSRPLQSQEDVTYKVLVLGDGGTGKTCFVRRYCHGDFQVNTRPTIGVDFSLKHLPDRPNPRTGGPTYLQLWDISGQERGGSMTRVYYRVAVGAMILVDTAFLSRRHDPQQQYCHHQFHQQNPSPSSRSEQFISNLKASVLWWKRSLDLAASMNADAGDDGGDPLPVLLVLNKIDLCALHQTSTTSDTCGVAEDNNTKSNRSSSSSLSPLFGVPVDALNQFCREHSIAGWCVASAKSGFGVNEAFGQLLEQIENHVVLLDQKRASTCTPQRNCPTLIHRVPVSLQHVADGKKKAVCSANCKKG